jgi:hypothetical protein
VAHDSLRLLLFFFFLLRVKTCNVHKTFFTWDVTDFFSTPCYDVDEPPLHLVPATPPTHHVSDVARWDICPYLILTGHKANLHIFCFCKVKVKLSLCLTKHHATKAYWGSGDTAPCIFYLGSRWRWVVSFTPRPLYSQGKSPWYPLDRRLGGPYSRSGRGGGEKNSQPPQGIKPWNLDSPARSPALYQLSYHDSLLFP